MKSLTKIASFTLCLAIITPVSIPVLATDNDSIEPRYIIVYYLNAKGVNLNPAKARKKSPGGLLFYGDGVVRDFSRDEYDSCRNIWAWVRVDLGQYMGI